MSEGEADLRVILETLDPNARDTLRRMLIHDQADRDAIASSLLRYRRARQRLGRRHRHADVAPRGATKGRADAGGRSTPRANLKGTETPIRVMTCIFRVTSDVTPRRAASAGTPVRVAAGSSQQAKPERLMLGLEDPYQGQSPT